MIIHSFAHCNHLHLQSPLAMVPWSTTRLTPFVRPPLLKIYTQVLCLLALKLTATASVAQSVERWFRDPESRVQFPGGGLGVAFFATGPGWVLKCISFFLTLEFTLL